MRTPQPDGRLLRGEFRGRSSPRPPSRWSPARAFAGVSHRTMAREANQPAAYYVKRADELLTAALTAWMDRDAERVRCLAEDNDGSPSVSPLSPSCSRT